MAQLEGTSPGRVKGPTEMATPRLQATPLCLGTHVRIKDFKKKKIKKKKNKKKKKKKKKTRDSLPPENLLYSEQQKGPSETSEAACIIEIS